MSRSFVVHRVSIHQGFFGSRFRLFKLFIYFGFPFSYRPSLGFYLFILLLFFLKGEIGLNRFQVFIFLVENYFLYHFFLWDRF